MTGACLFCDTNLSPSKDIVNFCNEQCELNYSQWQQEEEEEIAQIYYRYYQKNGWDTNYPLLVDWDKVEKKKLTHPVNHSILHYGTVSTIENDSTVVPNASLKIAGKDTQFLVQLQQADQKSKLNIIT